MDKRISKSVLRRLPGYYAHLKSLQNSDSPYISATAIANALNMGEVQVRKDLAMVSDGGRPKVGYLRERIIEDIEQFLGYDNTTDAILVGAGRLGQALLGYSGFDEYGLNILAAFDIRPDTKRKDSGKPILPMDQLVPFCQEHKILMGIITVPTEFAQEACDHMIRAGIKAIWTFAPTHLDVPDHVMVHNENMANSLAILSMHLQAQMKDRK